MRDDGATVLIVDDNRAMTQVLRFHFEKAGFSTTVAFNGADAVRKLREQHVDLVVTVLQMLEMDGGELCHHIREVMELKDLPIILCSARSLEVESTRLAITYDISHVFYKPISPKGIVAYACELFESPAVSKL